MSTTLEGDTKPYWTWNLYAYENNKIGRYQDFDISLGFNIVMDSQGTHMTILLTGPYSK